MSKVWKKEHNRTLITQSTRNRKEKHRSIGTSGQSLTMTFEIMASLFSDIFEFVLPGTRDLFWNYCVAPLS